MNADSISARSRSGFSLLLMPLMIVLLLAAPFASKVSAHGGALLLSRRDGVIRYISEVGLAPVEVARGYDPDMHPDGVSIVYVTEEVEPGGPLSSTVWIKNTRTGSVRSLIRADGRVVGPKWSPGGEKVAFMMFGGEGLWTLHVAGADGSGIRRVAPHGNSREAFSPGSLAWHSGGESILVHDLELLFRYSLDGIEEERMQLDLFTGEIGTVTSSDRFIPCPGQEGIWAFTMSVPGSPVFEKKFSEPNQAIFIMDLNSGERERLTPVDMFATDIDWSRSGKVIYFSGYSDSLIDEDYPFRVYSLDVGTLKITEVCPGEQPSQ